MESDLVPNKQTFGLFNLILYFEIDFVIQLKKEKQNQILYLVQKEKLKSDLK